MSQRSSLRKIIVTGALGAISVVLFLTNLGLIPNPLGGVSLTVMHVPVIIGAVLEGPVVGTAVGLIFGLSTLIKAAVAPPSPNDIIFVNPLISVLPRLFIGLFAYLAYKAFRGKREPGAAATAGIVGSLTNSVLVLGALVLFGAIPLAGAALLFVSNSLLEAVVAAVLTLGVVVVWKGVGKGAGKAKLADEEK